MNNKEKFRLYSNEKMIVKKTKNKLKGYGNSTKELLQKENELFHLLCFLNIDNKLELYDQITPNEPGDFLINIGGKKIMIEIAECFGNKNTYIYMNNQLNMLFKRKNKNIGNYNFRINDAKEKIKKIILNKNEKKYNNKKEYDEVVLLIVTGEYENCPATGNWLIKFLTEEDINKSNYVIYVLNYFYSSKDGSPGIIKNLKNEIIQYKLIFNNYK